MSPEKLAQRKNSKMWGRLECKAHARASHLGLYVVFSGLCRDRHWDVYCAKTGKLVLGYWPNTLKWRDQGDRVGRSEPIDVLDVAKAKLVGE